MTADDIARVARRYLHDANCTVASLDPQGTRAQTAADRVELHEAGEIQKFELSNGLRLLVREDARLPLVYLDAVFRGGLLVETPADNGLTKLFSRVLLKGTERRTAAQLAEEIEAVGGSIGSDGGNNSFSVSMEVMQPDLALGLDILADVLLHATLPAESVEREKAVQAAAIKAEDEHMTSLARNRLRAEMFGAHPYALRSSGSLESVGRLDRAQLEAFRRRHVVAKNGVVAVFGNVDAAEVRAQVERLFASMPAGEMALEHPPQPDAPAESRLLEHFEDKEQAVLMVGYAGTTIDGA